MWSADQHGLILIEQPVSWGACCWKSGQVHCGPFGPSETWKNLDGLRAGRTRQPCSEIFLGIFGRVTTFFFKAPARPSPCARPIIKHDRAAAPGCRGHGRDFPCDPFIFCRGMGSGSSPGLSSTSWVAKAQRQ